MAKHTVVRRAQCFPVPDDLDDDIAAAIPNPGVSAWLSLKHRARLAPSGMVLILGRRGSQVRWPCSWPNSLVLDASLPRDEAKKC
jgi:D-arabinose 1-dehydrogenase-like Zn-dependent alcohol dehydrogenase